MQHIINPPTSPKAVNLTNFSFMLDWEIYSAMFYQSVLLKGNHSGISACFANIDSYLRLEKHHLDSPNID